MLLTSSEYATSLKTTENLVRLQKAWTLSMAILEQGPLLTDQLRRAVSGREKAKADEIRAKFRPLAQWSVTPYYWDDWHGVRESADFRIETIEDEMATNLQAQYKTFLPADQQERLVRFVMVHYLVTEVNNFQEMTGADGRI
jgi:hypothetical protein